MALPTIIGGKKGNLSATLSAPTTFNQALQDSAVGVTAAEGATVTIEQSDQGAIDAAREISRDAFNFGGDALSAVRDSAQQSNDFGRSALDLVRGVTETARDTVNGATETLSGLVKKALETANIRSQVPAETIASDGGATLRVGLIAGAAIIGLMIYRRGR